MTKVSRYRKKGAAKVSKTVKAYVKNVMDKDIEDKETYRQVDITFSNDVTSGGACFTLLNGVEQGADVGQRVGARIRMKWIDIFLAMANSNRSAPQRGRVMLLLDRQPNRGFPSSTALLFNQTAGQSYASRLNVIGKQRFHILFDRVFDFNNQAAESVGEIKHLRLRLKCPWVTTFFAPAIDDPSSMETNSLWLVHIGDEDEEVIAHTDWKLTYEDA